MKKKLYRYFGGLIQAQQNWLNKLASQGYRLIHVNKLLYEFEKCSPGSVQYRIEFIGAKSRQHAGDYVHFLEDLGYRVFYKNMNLNYSIGKVRWRPWAEKGGQIACNGGTFNRELLIVEKENDGKPFSLYTSLEDEIQYYKTLRKPYLTAAVLFMLLGMLEKPLLLGICALSALIPVLLYQRQIARLIKEARIKEW